MEETITIYGSGGLLGHEHQLLWGEAVDDDAVFADKVVAALPDGYRIGHDELGQTLIEDADGERNLLGQCLYTTDTYADPDLTFVKLHGPKAWVRVPLRVIERTPVSTPRY